MSPPKTTRSPATAPPGANETLPPHTMTSPDTRAAMRTSASTETTRPGTSWDTTMSRRTEVMEPGAAQTAPAAPKRRIPLARTQRRRAALIEAPGSGLASGSASQHAAEAQSERRQEQERDDPHRPVLAHPFRQGLEGRRRELQKVGGPADRGAS